MIRLLYFFFLSLTLYACSEEQKVPSSIIPPKKMEKVFWDYLKADAFCNGYVQKDSTQNDSLVNIVMQKRIFEHYKITEEDFYNSYQYYISHPQSMTALIDSMVAHQRQSFKVFDAR
jgi:hypothetical protein